MGRRIVDPERTRRYLKRTMTEPERSVTVDQDTLYDHQDRVQRALVTDLEWPEEQPWEAWMKRVQAYGEAKGFRPEIFTETLPMDFAVRFSWSRPNQAEWRSAP